MPKVYGSSQEGSKVPAQESQEKHCRVESHEPGLEELFNCHVMMKMEAGVGLGERENDMNKE